MKNVKIVLVAEWDGWCGTCAADRPLVLTRSGRQRLRTWLTGAADDSRPLVLTCRLCGIGQDVPLERDDPPVLVTVEERETQAPAPVTVVEALQTQPLPAASEPVPASAPSSPELSAGHQALARALGGLLTQRSAAAAVPQTAPSAAPVVPQLAAPAAAPAVPLQRTAPAGGLAELQLLADGIDLLSTGRA